MQDRLVENLQVRMIHENLAETPIFECPSPYRLELYQSGRENAWLYIHEIADQFNVFTPFVFTDQFGSNKNLLADQQFYLLDQGGEPVGTATAWTDTRGTYSGRVHWVAILPEHQGRGLAKPLLSVVCRKLLEIGHSKGCLSTSTARVAAINLYLKFGFQPLIQSDEDEVAWSTFERRQPN